MTTNINDEVRPQIERPEININDANWRAFQRYRGKQMLRDGTGIVGPGGVVIDGRPWRGFKHSAQVQVYVQNQPEELLLNPDPRCKYAWRPREDPKHSTEALVGRGCLRPVEFSEVDQESELRMWVYEYSGAGKDADGDDRVVGLVASGNMGLFEVAPRWAYEWYDAAVDQTFADLGAVKSGDDLRDRAESWAARNRGMEIKGSSVTVNQGQNVKQEIRNPVGPGVAFADVREGSRT